MVGIIIGIAGIIIGIVGIGVAVWTSKKSIAADNFRHLEEIKRENELRKTDVEQERLQREIDYQKQKDLVENQKQFHLAQDREKKNALILNILSEIHSNQNFLIVNNRLYAGGNYSIVFNAIGETVQQQVLSFRNQTLIAKLTEYRSFVHKVLQVFNKVNNYPVTNIHSAAAMSEVVPQSNWNSMAYEGRRLNEELLQLLAAEYEGEVPREFQNLRVG